ncbi:hypothetical protein BSKO_10468 [Bryopsis sp. KO-2023]|nr:hypothetical protein BSKO_10468 [Bryopsis sp. KO-2023]
MTFQGYSPDHPLWRDVNFTPDWVYVRIQQQAASPIDITNETQETLPGADQPWTGDEDSLLLFARTDNGRGEGLSYQSVATALGRTMGAVKSRWFREVRPWHEKEAEEKVNAKIEQGRKLAIEKYKLPLRSLKT